MKLNDNEVERLKNFLGWAKSQGIKIVNLDAGIFEFSEAFILTEQASNAVGGGQGHNAPTSGTDTSNQKEPTDEEMLFWSAEPVSDSDEPN